MLTIVAILFYFLQENRAEYNLKHFAEGQSIN